MNRPQEKVENISLLKGYCRDRTTVNCLLTVACIAGISVDDPCLIVSELKYLGAEFRAKPATDAQIQVYHGEAMIIPPFLLLCSRNQRISVTIATWNTPALGCPSNTAKINRLQIKFYLPASSP